jgi:hypothetical protein
MSLFNCVCVSFCVAEVADVTAPRKTPDPTHVANVVDVAEIILVRLLLHLLLVTLPLCQKI